MNTQNLTPLTPQKDMQVHGWLSFFLFVVGFGAAITVVVSIASFSLDAYDTGLGAFFTYFIALIDIAYTLGIARLAIYTILAFLHKRSNAVFLGKSYLVVIFLSNVLQLLGGDYDDYGLGSLSQIVRALILGVIWFVYLCLSEQVSDLFPKEERKILGRDKYIVGSLVLTPVILWGILLLVYLGSVSTPLDVSLEYGEYSDGTVVFRAPENALCEKTDTLDNVYHTFAIGDSIWGTVIGVYDTNTGEEYFKECVESWRDAELDGYDFSVLDTHKKVVNGSIMRMQSVKYETRPSLIWQFSILFSPETGKACIASLYSTAEETENIMNVLMSSVRFK